MNAEELRRRGLNFARRQIAAGKATRQDIDRWAEEFGDEVRRIASSAPQSAPARKPARPTLSNLDTSKE
jgi:hypothetical protein